jgi:hypothetical protein
MVDFWLTGTDAVLGRTVLASGDNLVSDVWTRMTRSNFRRFRTTDLSGYSVTNARETAAEAFVQRYHPSDRATTVAFARQQAVLDVLQTHRGEWRSFQEARALMTLLPADQRAAAIAQAEAFADDIAEALARAEGRKRRAKKKAST